MESKLTDQDHTASSTKKKEEGDTFFHGVKKRLVALKVEVANKTRVSELLKKKLRVAEEELKLRKKAFKEDLSKERRESELALQKQLDFADRLLEDKKALNDRWATPTLRYHEHSTSHHVFRPHVDSQVQTVSCRVHSVHWSSIGPCRHKDDTDRSYHHSTIVSGHPSETWVPNFVCRNLDVSLSRTVPRTYDRHSNDKFLYHETDRLSTHLDIYMLLWDHIERFFQAFVWILRSWRRGCRRFRPRRVPVFFSVCELIECE